MHVSERLVVAAKALISHAIEGVPGYQRTRQIRLAKARENAIESGRAALTGPAAGRGDDPKNVLAAMEVEGIDVSIVFCPGGELQLGAMAAVGPGRARRPDGRQGTVRPHHAAQRILIDTFLGLEGISDDSKRKILWDNCARLYRIEAPSEAG